MLQLENSDSFGPCLSACVQLRTFRAYKLWGLGHTRRGKIHKVKLPNCLDMNLYRSDDLERLELNAPMLSSLNLQVSVS